MVAELLELLDVPAEHIGFGLLRPGQDADRIDDRIGLRADRRERALNIPHGRKFQDVLRAAENIVQLLRAESAVPGSLPAAGVRLGIVEKAEFHIVVPGRFDEPVVVAQERRVEKPSGLVADFARRAVEKGDIVDHKDFPPQ